MKQQIYEALSAHEYQMIRTQEEEIVIFYKYVNGIYKVVLTAEDHSGTITVPKLQMLLHSIHNIFYHPMGKVPGYEEGQPIYDVKVLAYVFGNDVANLKVLCANLQSVWAYDLSSGLFLTSENETEAFDELKEAFSRKELMQEKLGRKDGKENGKIRADWISAIKQYYIVIILISLNTLIYLVLELMGDTEDGLYMLKHGAAYAPNIVEDGEYWRLLSSTFLHFGLSHLLNNMVIFGCVGVRVEDALGHWKFLLLYLLAGLGGSLLSLADAIISGNEAISAGASGAVFGVIGALLWIVVRHKGRYQQLTTRGLLFMIALSLYYGISTVGIDNFAHLGGLITGFVMSMILYRKKN